MDTAHPTTGWEQVGDRFYRRLQLYTAVFDQDLDLDNYTVAGAPYGGAIGTKKAPWQYLLIAWWLTLFWTSTALYRDEDKIVAHRPHQSSKPSIDIYSSAGRLLRSIAWDKGSVKGLGWSDDEKLLVVSQDGTVRCYLDLQGDFTQFSLGNGAEEYGVVSCK